MLSPYFMFLFYVLLFFYYFIVMIIVIFKLFVKNFLQVCSFFKKGLLPLHVKTSINPQNLARDVRGFLRS